MAANMSSIYLRCLDNFMSGRAKVKGPSPIDTLVKKIAEAISSGQAADGLTRDEAMTIVVALTNNPDTGEVVRKISKIEGRLSC